MSDLDLRFGDCLSELKLLENDSVDLVCTDPPYGYSFMGKDWDKAVPSVEMCKEYFEIAKARCKSFSEQVTILELREQSKARSIIISLLTNVQSAKVII